MPNNYKRYFDIIKEFDEGLDCECEDQLSSESDEEEGEEDE